jgi:hypothetical protein
MELSSGRRYHVLTFAAAEVPEGKVALCIECERSFADAAELIATPCEKPMRRDLADALGWLAAVGAAVLVSWVLL